MPAATLNIDWKLIEGEAVSGVPIKTLAEKYGVRPDTISKRAFDYKWMTPSRMIRHMKKKKGAVIATIQEQAEAYASKVFAFTKDKVLSAVALDTVPVPKNAKELDTMDRIARRAAGLDKPEAAKVSVNLAMFTSEDEGGWRDTASNHEDSLELSQGDSG